MADEGKAEKGTERLTVRIGKLEKMMADFLRAQGYMPPDEGQGHKQHEPAHQAPAQAAPHAGHGGAPSGPGLSPELARMNELGERLIRVLEEILNRL